MQWEGLLCQVRTSAQANADVSRLVSRCPPGPRVQSDHHQDVLGSPLDSPASVLFTHVPLSLVWP